MLLFSSNGVAAVRYNRSASSKDSMSNCVNPNFSRKVRTLLLSWFTSRFIPGIKEPFTYKYFALRHTSDMESHNSGISRRIWNTVFASMVELGFGRFSRSAINCLTPRRTRNSARSGSSDEHCVENPAVNTCPGLWWYERAFEILERKDANRAALSCSGT